ncbi:MAG: aldo/keto reductase, partial [Candidatus Lokiarchaeota archaeon]
MRSINIRKTNEKIPVLGQGTGGIQPREPNESYEKWKDVLRAGIEVGMTHIDTAEIYGMGKSERMVGEVIKEFDRDDLFITTKIAPTHKNEKEMKLAVNNSLKRLGLKYVDLYLIHWLKRRQSVKQIINFLETLIDEGKTRYIGVSNLSLDRFKSAQQELKKHELIANEVKLNIDYQEAMKESLQYFQREGIILIAYSPLGRYGLKKIEPDKMKKLEDLGNKYNATPHQIALAWLINHENVIAIPKTFQIEHVKQNA